MLDIITLKSIGFISMSDKYLIIDSRPYGLFSIFLHTIDCLKWCEDNKHIPFIRWASGRININLKRQGAHEASLNGHPRFVLDKENFVTDEKLENNKKYCLYAEKENDNVWEYYFEPVNTTTIETALNNNPKINDIFMCGELDFDLNNKFLIRNIYSYDSLKLWSVAGTTQELQHREEINNIIKKYVKIKDYIIEKVENFFNIKMKSKTLIGVHVRGTDKKSEYPFKQLTINDYAINIKEIINNIKTEDYKIYIASDNNESIVSLANIFGKDKVVAYPSLRIPKFYASVPMCLLDNIDRKIHGEQTLIEMLLLSMCNYIIGTDSNLTAAANFFNPVAEFVYLNRENGNRS